MVFPAYRKWSSSLNICQKFKATLNANVKGGYVFQCKLQIIAHLQPIQFAKVRPTRGHVTPRLPYSYGHHGLHAIALLGTMQHEPLVVKLLEANVTPDLCWNVVQSKRAMQ